MFKTLQVGHQIKTIMRYNFTPARVVITKKTETIRVGQDLEKLELSHAAGRNVKWFSLGGKVWRSIKKFNIELP